MWDHIINIHSNGNYSVKFGYKFLHEEHLVKQPGPSENDTLKPLWKKIWGLNVPNKVKHLAWKACKDSLPTKMNLVRRKITTTSTCDRCKMHQEDAVHALLHCPDLKPLWCTRPKWNHGTLLACSSFIDVFDFIFAGNNEPELFAAVIWTLWNRRNNLCLGKPSLPLDKVLEFAQERLMGSETTNVPPSHPYGRSTTHWTAPEANGFKINFDGATFADSDSAASVTEVEALAAIRALEFAMELGFDDITLEGDSELLIKNLINEGSKLTHYGNIKADILFLLSHFSKVSLSFVRRHCNRLAHSLARRAIIPPIMSVWMEEIPPDLASVFLADLESLP
ncbi:hypothetical protein SO802_013204 [Lithocarpus litseifolius]|uniref:Reverse transcriptase n=1 Tax=Lithocarpus litseifolius TaxID=425828 RepID=A0AAW2D4Y8_9ROSI